MTKNKSIIIMEDYSFLKTNDPYVLTPNELILQKLELLELKDGETLFDLGVGDARSLITACGLANVKGVGYEISPEAIDIANKNILQANLTDRIEIRQQSLYEADISNADALIIYLTRTMLGGISLKLEEELPPGARIVTHQFDLPGWEAEKEIQTSQNNGSLETIYFYRKAF
jgi:precorrin-6B methylase 2